MRSRVPLLLLSVLAALCASASACTLLLGASAAISASLAVPDVAPAETPAEDEEEQVEAVMAEAAEEEDGEDAEDGQEEEEEVQETSVVEEEEEEQEEAEEEPADAAEEEEVEEEEEEEEESYSKPQSTAAFSKTDYGQVARKALPAAAIATSGLIAVRLASAVLLRGSSSGKVYKVRRAVRTGEVPAAVVVPETSVKFVPNPSDPWLDRQIDKFVFWLKAKLSSNKKAAPAASD